MFEKLSCSTCKRRQRFKHCRSLQYTYAKCTEGGGHTAVLAVGARKRDGSALREACSRIGCGYFEVGDAVRAINATREAFDVALSFDKEKAH
ncbi:MAG: hypothetical protein K2O16_16925 [Lachnospiraceae bacterium]|nr:hypothetical protein [Lachnospiraceae bacterium]